MLLFFLVQVFYSTTLDFNCNGKYEIKVPNFRVTAFFLEELFRVKVSDMKSIKCSGMDYTSFEETIFEKASGLKTLDLSNNKLHSLRLPYSQLDEVNLSSNNFSKFSEFTNRQQLEIKKLDLSKNNLTSDSNLFRENIIVSSELDLSNNLLTAIDLNKMFKKGPLHFTHLNISNNFISALDSQLITLIAGSENVVLCPMLINVVCRQKGTDMNVEVQKLMNRAGKLDLSCLSTSLPGCGGVSVSFKNEKDRKSINILFDLPDLKRVFIEKSVKIKLSSAYFKSVIANIHKDNLVDNKFSLSIKLSKTAPKNEKIIIYLHEVRSEGFDDALSPKIAYFILKSDGNFELYQKNFYIDSKLKMLGVAESTSTDESDGFVEEITHNSLAGVYYFWSIFAIVILFIILMIYFKIVEKIAKRRNSLNDFYEVSN